MYLTDVEAERETYWLFEQWLSKWKKENPDNSKPSGTDAFVYFYSGVLTKTSSGIIAPGREWQDVHAWLRGQGYLEG